MVKNILVLDDGTEIAAGTVGQNAILSLTCTETVSKTTDLCPGAACSNKLEITIWVEPGTDLPITSGTRLTHYRETSGQRTLAGTYWAVKPTSQTRNTYKIYAYDAVSLLDGVQSTWLRSIQDQFPMTLWKFAGLVAQRCGVTIVNSSLPRNGTYLVQAFYADNLTGRQLLAWVAEASCTFLRATSDGKIEFAWYTDYSSSQSIGPTVYIRDGLSHDKFQTAPVVKVQIRQSDDDVGVLYPSDESGSNALVIQGNLLLTSATAEALKPVAQAIFETMQGVTYTPLKVTVPADFPLPAPGNIVSVTDARGNVLSSYIMNRTISGQQVTLESTGNATRDGTAAVNEQSYKNLTGKMLEIKTSVDGLEVKASDLTGKYTDLKATVDGLSSEVKKDTKITGGGNLILGSESFKNANYVGIDSSVAYGDDGSATITNANTNRYFIFNTAGARITKGVTLCLSVMYKPISGTDGLCLSLTFAGDNGTSYVPSIKTENAVSKTYVGSGVTKKSAATYTPGTSDQSIASGQYLNGTQTIKGDSNLTAANIKSGVKIFNVTGSYAGSSSGGNTPNLQTKTVTPSESTQTVSPDSGYDGLSKVTVNAISNTYIGSDVTKKSAATYIPKTTDQSIASGQYLSGTQTIKGDANLVAGNIKSGVNIFGVTGTYAGGGSSGDNGNNNVEAYAITDTNPSVSFKTASGTIKIWGYGTITSSGGWGGQTTSLVAFEGDKYHKSAIYGGPSSTNLSLSISNGKLTGLPSGLSAISAIVTRGI